MTECEDCGENHGPHFEESVKKLTLRFRLFVVVLFLSLVVVTGGAFMVHPGWAVVAVGLFGVHFAKANLQFIDHSKTTILGLLAQLKLKEAAEQAASEEPVEHSGGNYV